MTALLDPTELRASHRRFCRFFADRLDALSDAHETTGPSALQAITAFDLEFDHIGRAWAWARREAPTDPEAASLCAELAHAGSTLFALRLPPVEYLAWMEEGLAAAESSDEEALVGSLLNQVAGAHYALGRYGDAMAQIKRALAHSERLGDDARCCFDLEQMGDILMGQGTYNEALAHHERALALAERLGAPARIQSCRVSIGADLLRLDRYEDAIEVLEKALEEPMSPVLETIAHEQLSATWSSLHEGERALEHAQRALAVSQQMGAPNWILTGQLAVASAYFELDLLADAHALFLEALETARELGVPDSEQAALHGLGSIALAEGAWEEALQHHTAELVLAEALTDIDAQGVAHGAIADCHRAGWNHLAAIEPGLSAARAFRSSGAAQSEVRALHETAWSLLFVGQLDLAAQCWDVALERLDSEAIEALRSELMHGHGWLALRRGELDAASRCFTSALELGQEHDDGADILVALSSLAEVELARDRPAVARDLLEAAIEAAREAEDDDNLPLLLAALAEAMRRLGDLAVAEELLDEALEGAALVDEREASHRALACLALVRRDQGQAEWSTSLREALSQAEAIHDAEAIDRYRDMLASV